MERELIKKFKSFIEQGLPTKEDLDKITSKEIDDFRYYYIQKNFGYNRPETNQQYLDELEIYKDLRFKQDRIDMYNTWKQECEDWEGDKNDWNYQTKSLITKVGSDNMYNLSIGGSFKKIETKWGGFKYFTDMEIPEEAKKFRDNTII